MGFFRKSGFTLMELLIVVALIALILIAFFILLNPIAQIKKSWDTKRKKDLDTLRKVLEDWYDDKGCYPKPEEICYDSVQINNTCHICGKENQSLNFFPYLSSIPCDPQHPLKKYLYQIDNITCPKWYRVYTDLSNADFTNFDSDSVNIGCPFQSCGPAPSYGYDYGINSPNINLEKLSSFAYCANSGCNACGPPPSTYEDCLRISLSKYCNGKRLIIPFAICNRSNCPCSPY